MTKRVWRMSNIAAEAKPLSRDQIRDFSERTRIALGVNTDVYVDVEGLIDLVLPRMIPDFHYDVREAREMGEKHGEADPAQMRISLRKDVYEGMVQGKGRDRFTVLHEIGHLLLHQPDRIILNRMAGQEKLKAFRDPEWQADCFAGEFLAYYGFIGQFESPAQMSDAMGISLKAARYQWKKYHLVDGSSATNINVKEAVLMKNV